MRRTYRNKRFLIIGVDMDTTATAQAAETLAKIKQQIADNRIIVYMKGSPKLPSCGFSSQIAQILMACDVEFAYIDILKNPDIRVVLPSYAAWPTFPQLWVNGELVGGCDIVVELYQRGELKPLLLDALNPSV